MAGSIPTEADWRSERWGIDTPYAYEHFAGKSAEEAFALFKQTACYYSEDLLFMPDACFPFYVGAYMSYLLSADSKGDAEGAYGFFGLVEIRAKLITSRRELASAVDAVLTHLSEGHAWFDVDISIDGDFAERAAKSRAELATARTST